MADDRDALIATLIEEGWERAGTPAWWTCITKAGVWLSATEGGYARLNAGAWWSSFPYATPNSVILAAARAAVEAEQ